jgi:outer membrane protein assembly factor BamB
LNHIGRNAIFATAGNASRERASIRKIVLLVGTLAVVLAVAPTIVASAVTTAQITLSKTKAPPTALVVVSGSGFGTSESVALSFDTTLVAAAQTDVSGNFSQQVRIPASALPGAHAITALGQSSGFRARHPFTVRTNWAQFRFDDRHSGFNPYENVLDPSNVSGLVVTWKTSLGCGYCSYSSPAVVNGVVYVGSGNGNVYAFDAATGALRWIASAGSEVISSPTVASGVVLPRERQRQPLRLRRRDRCSALDPIEEHNAPSPAVTNGVVCLGGAEHALHAFNARTGLAIWSRYTGAPISSVPAVANGVVYVGSQDGLVYAFDAATGRLRWSTPTGLAAPAPIVSSPAVANRVVYIGSLDHKLYAFDAETGQTLSNPTTGGQVNSSPAVANGLVYLASGDGNLYAFGLQATAP